MKTIGLIGGTSWPSTILYYEHLNRMAQAELGGYHSARLILHNVDYHRMKSSYAATGGREEIPGYLNEEIDTLAAMKPDCIVICNNTLHKGLDILSGAIQCQTDIPYIHIIDAVAAAAKEKEQQSLLLLGTKFTMEDGFYAKKLEEKHGLTISVPDEDDRNIIQEMQTAIALGNMEDSFRGRFGDILERYKNYDAAILACTELPLAIAEDNCPIPIIDPIYEQCRAAIAFAFTDV